MTGRERAAVAAMVGLSGAAVMAAILWQDMGGPEWPLILFAFGGAAVAGAPLADKFGRRWPVAILASLTATVFGAALGAFMAFPSAEVLMIGPCFVVAALLNAPPALAIWVLSQLAVHLAVRRLRGRNPWLADPAG